MTAPATATAAAPAAAPPAPRAGRRAALKGFVWVPILAALAVVVPAKPSEITFPWTASASAIDLAGFAAIFAVVAYGLALLMRLGGLPSVVHGALWGVGSYVAAILLDRWGWGFWAVLPFAAVVPALLAVVIGVIALRSSGITFIVITLAMGSFLVLIANNWESLTGGRRGIVALDGIGTLGGVDFADPVNRYYLLLAFVAVTIALSMAIDRTAFARRSVAIRDNEVLARSLGLDPLTNRLALFALSSAFCGVGGVLFFYHQTIVNPELFDPFQFISIFLMVVIGGTGAIAGPLVGAWFVTFLPYWAEPLGIGDTDSQRIVYGALLVAVALLAPDGIVGGIGRLVGFARGVRRDAGRRPMPDVGQHGGPAPSVRADVPPRTPVRADAPVLLEAVGVAKRYGALEALKGVDLTVRQGTIHGIIGPNGSGKTTLFHCISGFVRVSGGQVLWRGEDVTRLPAHRRARAGIVRTFQQPMVFPTMTVGEACRVARERSRHGPHRTDEVIELCGLGPYVDVSCDVIPYGVTRMLAIALAVLAGDPELLLLDEPAAGLNDTEDDTLAHVLRSLNDGGMTILVVDHDMPFLLPLCDRITALDGGSLIFDGPPDQVQHDRAVVAAYLGERFAERMAAGQARS